MNTPVEILNKIFAYCAYQERCRQEVKQKLRSLGAEFSEFEEILAYLEEEGFLDEERFASSFAGGKFRVKHWGRMKIRTALRKKGISESQIDDALSREISEEDYIETLNDLLRKKLDQLEQEEAITQKEKTIRHFQQKGYEWDAIFQAWEDVQSERF